MAFDSADVSVGVSAPERSRRAALSNGPPARRVTVTAPRRGGPATRFAAALDGRHPAVVFAAAEILGYVALVVATIGLGLLLTHIVLPFHGIGNADERPVAWLADRRTPFLTDASLVGSMIGDWVLVAVVVVVSVTLAVLRHWRIAAFVALALIAESEQGLADPTLPPYLRIFYEYTLPSDRKIRAELKAGIQSLMDQMDAVYLSEEMSFEEAVREYRRIEEEFVERAGDDEADVVETRRCITERLLHHALDEEQPHEVCREIWHELLQRGFSSIRDRYAAQ